MGKYSGTSTLESMSQAGFYNKWTLNKFKKYLKGDILEVGCGIGNFTPILFQFGTVTAIDINPNLFDKFKNQKNLTGNVGIGDIEKGKYFFKGKKFDTIVCLNVLEHIENDTQALKNMFGLLKEKGNLILLVPTHNFLYGEIDKSIGHFRRYNPKSLIDKLKELRFNIIFSRKINLIGALGWFISGRVLRNNQVTENKVKLFNLISPILYLENFIEPPIGTSVLIITRKDQQ